MSEMSIYYQKIFEKIKEFKKELQKQSFFNDDEKNIIFKKFLESTFNIKRTDDSISNSSNFSNISDVKSRIEASTFASLLNKTDVSSHTDIVLLATYYLVIKENYESVSVKDILEQYKKAYRKPSKNTSVFVAKNLKKGNMMLLDKKDSNNVYTITHEGIKHAQEMLENAK